MPLRHHTLTVHRIPVWDIPVRLFHWSLLIATTLAFVSAKTDWLDSHWHLYAGISVTFLWLFRVLWGLCGTRTARFSHFLPTPARLIAQFKHPSDGVGHSASGGLSVFAMLFLLAAMWMTGVFADDDISLHGPLASYIDTETSDWFSAWHGKIFTLLLLMVGLHMAAILFYALVKRDALLPPMITGYKTLPAVTQGNAMPRGSHYWRNLFLSLTLSAALTWALFSPQIHGVFLPSQPKPVVPASTHTW